LAGDETSEENTGVAVRAVSAHNAAFIMTITPDPDESRSDAARIFFGERWPLTRKLTLFLFSVLLASGVTLFASASGFEQPALNALFILVLAAGLWVSEAIPPFAVSILIIGYAIYFLEDASPMHITTDWEKYAATWANPIIWILIGGFVLALGAQVTGFDRRFSHVVIKRFGSSPRTVLLGIMLTTAVLSMFMSNTATTAMMLAVVAPILHPFEGTEPFRKSVILGIAAAATLGGMGTVIGSPPNALAVAFIQGRGSSFGFVEWMFTGIPLAISSVVIAWFLLMRRFKTTIKELRMVDADANGEANAGSVQRSSFKSRAIVVFTFTLTLGLWMTSSFHGIPVAVVSFIPIVSFTVSGVVRAEDIRLLPWDTLILVAGGLTLGIIITETGLAESLLRGIPSDSQALLVLLVLAYSSTLLSNVMSNTAAASILIPLGATLIPGAGIIVPITIGFCASTALLLPISTPPNALAYATGVLRQSDFRFLGGIAALVAPPLIMVIVMLVY
jgi:sodium-dependent dicarboxylate transporter 2/3/5